MRTAGELYTLDCRGVSIPMVWRVCECGCGKGFGVKIDSPQRHANRRCRPETPLEHLIRTRRGISPHPRFISRKSDPKQKGKTVKTFDPGKLKAMIAECAELSEAGLTLSEIAGSLNTKGFRTAHGKPITQKFLMNFRCRHPASRGNAPTRRGKRPKGERPLQLTKEQREQRTALLASDPPKFPAGLRKHAAVEHPSHYNTGKIEVIDAIADWDLNFQRGNVVKYVARAGRKDPKKELEDLEKAAFYLQWEIQRIRGKQ